MIDRQLVPERHKRPDEEKVRSVSIGLVGLRIEQRANHDTSVKNTCCNHNLGHPEG